VVPAISSTRRLNPSGSVSGIWRNVHRPVNDPLSAPVHCRPNAAVAMIIAVRARRLSFLVGAVALVVVLVVTLVSLGIGTKSSDAAERQVDEHHDVRLDEEEAHSGPGNPADSHTFLGPYGVEASWWSPRTSCRARTDWQIEDEPTSGSIAGFSNKTYAAAGNHVTLYVSSTAPRFRVEAYRMGYYGGKGGLLVWRSAEVTGRDQPNCPLTPAVNMVACDNWKPSLTFRITSAFLPGEYLLKLVGSGSAQSYVLLTVWTPRATRPTCSKGTCTPRRPGTPTAATTTTRGSATARPHTRCATGRESSRSTGPQPPETVPPTSSAMSTRCCASWKHMASTFTYADDITVEQHPSILLQHRALLSLGHDECWSSPSASPPTGRRTTA